MFLSSFGVGDSWWFQSCRDYNSELTEVLTLKDVGFQPHQLQLWCENVLKKSQPLETGFETMDSQINQLDKDAREAAFLQDTLKLARDCGQLAQLYKAETQHDRAVRLQKVTHLKTQNTVGASFIQHYMTLNVRHVAGRQGELEVALDEAGILVWFEL